MFLPFPPPHPGPLSSPLPLQEVGRFWLVRFFFQDMERFLKGTLEVARIG